MLFSFYSFGNFNELHSQHRVSANLFKISVVYWPLVIGESLSLMAWDNGMVVKKNNGKQSTRNCETHNKTEKLYN